MPPDKLVPNEQRLSAANSTPILVTGLSELSLTINKRLYPTTFYVSPNVDEVILGRDWLASNSVVWNFGENRVLIHGVQCKLHHRHDNNATGMLCRISTDVVVPAHSEAVLATNVVYSSFNPKTRADDQWTTVPSEPVPGLRLARTLLPTGTPIVPVRVCNITRRPIHLCTGQSLGNLQSVVVPSTASSVASPEPSAAEQRESITQRVDPSVPEEARQHLSSLIDKYHDIFSYSEFDLGQTGITEHHIDTGNNRPFRQPLRPQPRAQLPAIDRLLEGMLSQGIIEPSQSEWASNIVLVKKHDGNIRLCVDYRKLNSLTTKDAYPLPRIETCLDTLAGAMWYSTFDLRSGFHQVNVRPQDVNKTTFVCHRGTFRFPRMPFGVCGAPATFQRLMDTVLIGLNFEICLAYLDDIIVFSHDLPSHFERLEKLFQRLQDANLKLKPTKCRLLQRRVSFLGYTVSAAGVETDPEKISAITNWPTPQNLRQCRAFVGLCQYYRKFVPNFSNIAAPLHALTKKGARFDWSPECQSAFDKLKNSLSSAGVLALPRDEGTFILDCDASDKAIGAVLSQIQDGEERSICYGSQLYDKHQQNYNVTRKELLAMITFVKKFRQYLLGRPFIIRTDHAALQWLKSTPEPIGQQARWLEILEEFDFSVQHRPGTKHINADALSRRIGSVESTNSQPVGDNAVDWPGEQRADPDLAFICQLLETGETPPTPDQVTDRSADLKTLLSQFQRLSLTSDGTLCREFTVNSTGRRYLQKIVPSSMRSSVADELHKGLNGGHLRLRRARTRLQSRFYWPHWSTDVRLAKHRCPQCSKYHKPRPKHQGALQPLQTGEPWERLSIDITGPHPVSSRGNVYILSVIDHFSKWVELFPMKNQEASTVAKLLVDRVFCTHGCPLQILTDRGANFEIELFAQLCKQLAIDKIRTTAYKPSTNGAIERFHSTMHSLISKWIAENHKNWDELLPAVTFAYRTTVQEATGFTPFYMLFGREARVPADLVYGDPLVADLPTDDFVSRRQTQMRKAYALAREHLGRAAQRRKATYDLRVRPHTFEVGSYVWCLVPRRRPNRYQKWQSLYEGPFKVTRQLGPVTYEIQKNGRSKPWVVHVDKLKLCPDDTPEFMGNPSTLAADLSDNEESQRPKRTIRRPARYM